MSSVLYQLDVLKSFILNTLSIKKTPDKAPIIASATFVNDLKTPGDSACL
jgi:hypothetical protein